MLRRTAPEVGCWYEEAGQGRVFEVVSLDEDDKTVGIQYFEGEIEALELEAFMQLPLIIIEQPEDWSGPFELDNEDPFENDFTDAQVEIDELQRYDSDNNLHIVDDF